MDELEAYNYLPQLCSSQQEPEQFSKIIFWLTQKTECLLAAMEHSRQASQKADPYWQ